MKTIEEKNTLIAEFMGFQKTNIGWFDNEGVLDLPYTEDNTFDVLLFDKSWDWILPVVTKLFTQNDFWRSDNGMRMNDAILALNLEVLFNEIVRVIENLRGKKTFHITKSRFIEWYYESGQDQEIEDLKSDLVNIVIAQLSTNGKAEITVEQLFEDCNKESIKLSYLEEFDLDEDRELSELEEEYEVELID